MPISPPQIGVYGAQDIIQQGANVALDTLGQGIGMARADIQSGQQGLGNQAALAGLRGGDAQAQAFQDFQQSPGQQYLIDQAERATTRNAAATGGLSGGNVLQELQRNAIGLARQDFQDQFNRGQQALGSQQVGAQNLANLAATGGAQGAGIISDASNQLGSQRFRAGQQLSTQAQQQANVQAQLQAQLGQGTAQLQQQLATLLANIGTGSATNAAQMTAAAGQFDAAGTLGQANAINNAINQFASFL